ncbi:MAG: hypothetical protein NC397_05015 [Clostridium sp.]|nr:hypothetical protein [Clostridium sp.]
MTLLEKLRLAVVLFTIVLGLDLFIVFPLMERFDKEMPWWVPWLIMLISALVVITVFVLGIMLVIVKIKSM